MFRVKRSVNWKTPKELKQVNNKLFNKLNNLVILGNIWEKEVGVKGSYWQIDSVKGGIVFIKTKSSTAKQELISQKKIFIRNLNKHFKSKWIKDIRAI